MSSKCKIIIPTKNRAVGSEEYKRSLSDCVPFELLIPPRALDLRLSRFVSIVAALPLIMDVSSGLTKQSKVDIRTIGR